MANFFIPKSVFKGVNADGTKFTLKEWEWGSWGSSIEGFGTVIGIFIIFMLTSLVAPLMLIVSAFSYKGKLPIPSVIGIVVGCYFLYDSNHFWFASQLTAMVFGSTFVAWCVAITTASIFCHVVILLATVITSGKMFNPNYPTQSGIVWMVLAVTFMLTLIISLGGAKTHGTYNEFEKQDIAKQKTEDSIMGLNDEDMTEYYNDDYEKQCLERGDSPEEAHRLSHE